MYKRKSTYRHQRQRALERGLQPVSSVSAVPDASTKLARRSTAPRTAPRKSALQWYADRGALVEGDEDAAQNDLRLYAGEALARLYDRAFTRPRVTARYSAQPRGGSGDADAGFVRSEDARRAFEETFSALPHRTRSVVRLCVVEDQFVGRSRMERLRCGLDKLVEVQAQKKTQNDTKSVDVRPVV